MTLLRSILVVCLLAAAPVAAETFTVGPELWDRPRNARAVLNDAAVRRAVGAYLDAPSASVVVHHAPGTVPALQAEELRAWLAALGLSGAQVSLKSDLEPDSRLKIEVVTTP